MTSDMQEMRGLVADSVEADRGELIDLAVKATQVYALTAIDPCGVA